MVVPAPTTRSRAETVAPLRPLVAASWERCRAAGLEPSASDPGRAPARPTDPRLTWAATPVLEMLEAGLAGEPVGILLCDGDGTIVRTHGLDRGVRRAMDVVHLVPGGSTAEAVVGTNGMGLALREQRSWLMSGPEHFWEPLRGFTCAGVVIRDAQTGGVEGGLALATPSREHGHLLLALAGQASAHIGSRLREAPAASNGDGRPDHHPDGGPDSRPDGDADGDPASAPCRRRLSRIEDLEQQAIAAALRDHADVESAAAYLGFSRATVYRRIRRYGLRAAGHPAGAARPTPS